MEMASNGRPSSDLRRRTTADKNSHKHQNGNSVNPSSRDDYGYASAPLSDLLFIGAVRLAALVVWVGGVAYATYELFKAQERELPFNGDPKMNPGLLSGLLGRGKDLLDSEWRVIAVHLWVDTLIFFVIGAVLEKLLSLVKFRTNWLPALMSFLLLNHLLGTAPTTLMFLIPTLYWLALNFQRKSAIWVMTVGLMALMGNDLLWPSMFHDVDDAYIFMVIFAWNISRCVSFCMDVWDRENKYEVSALCSFYQYVFFLPLLVSGPLITYEHFERERLNKIGTSPAKGDIFALFKGLFRITLYAALMEAILHFIYYESFALYLPAVINSNSMNLWVICGIVYWLGQGFGLKYKVLYGLPSCLAEYDGVKMYQRPCCPAYVHRHSVLWKDFDRGLYTFLVKYIYVPMISYLNTNPNTVKMSGELKKFCASMVTFAYVYIWHSLAYPIFVWTVLNFAGVTLERIGSLIKKDIDHRTIKSPLVWDFVVEPLITIPLAAMSLLNSTVFCGNIDAAAAIYHRLMATCTPENLYHFWIAFFLYSFCHVGVAVRTWTPFKNALLRQSQTMRKLS